MSAPGTVMTEVRHVLIIKLSALGDVVQAFGPIRAIRNHHPKARITVLTTRPYAGLFEACPDVDQVWVDARPKWYHIGKWWALRRQLRSVPFDWVYDLQTSGRSSGYRRLMNGLCPLSQRPVPAWSGIAKGCSHPHANPKRDFMHTIERQSEQLRMAGIVQTPFPNIDWLDGDIAALDVPDSMVLLVPGGAPHRPDKRWPADRFAALARKLISAGISPVVLGTQAESDAIDAIVSGAPGTISLCGKTGFVDIATLGRMAKAAVGNDTGPMHMLSIAGCPCVVLYSFASDPALCAQRGAKVEILRTEQLNALSEDEVWQKVTEIVG